MKQFFNSFLGTIAGIIVSVFILFLILAGIAVSLVNSSTSDKPLLVKANSILQIKLDKEITERATDNPFGNLSFVSKSLESKTGLNEILKNIQKAKTDNNIKGIYLDLSVIRAGIATVEEIRNVLIDFKTSGKFIISYGEIYTQKAYYLASVADRVYLNPQGTLEWKGLSAQIMFFKGTLDKLEIDVQIFRHGKFKSAIEPFNLDAMSVSNRKQTRAYIGAIWNHILEGVSASRKIDAAALNNFAGNMLIQNAEDAVKYNLADSIQYKDEVLANIKKRLSLGREEKINFVDIDDYTKAPEIKKLTTSKDKIAIVYAVGTIEGGEGEEETVGSEGISKAIRDAHTDTNVKAIVLRINSPGGSALASDIIWREVFLAQKSKPVVVSMADVAASGGYYIACAADAIVAQPNTITGSIGVFGILPNAKKFFNDKLGITFDTVNTNKHADLGAIYRPVNSEEALVVQKSVETIYQAFISKVAQGRKMSVASVDSIGQGRVWSGVDAKAIGLVDELGGIETALKLAAKKAHIENYKILSLPKQKTAIEKLLKQINGEVESKIVAKELGEYSEYYQQLKASINFKGIYARMPYEVVVY